MEESSKALTGKLQPWLDRLRSAQPLVHCITNYVTVNDVASLLLACGASPLMADAEEDAAEMATIAGACTSLQPAPTRRVFPLRSTR